MKIKTGLLLTTMAVAGAMTVSAGAIADNKKSDKNSGKYSQHYSSKSSGKDYGKDYDKDYGKSYGKSYGKDSWGNGKYDDRDDRGRDHAWNWYDNDDRDRHHGWDWDYKDHGWHWTSRGHGWGHGSHGNSGGHPGGKVEICHLTGSTTNPSVLITVSVNAANAHYAHGDPVDFTILPNGSCAAVVDDPDEPVLQPLCAGSSAFGPFTEWAILYDPESGEFTGIEAGATTVTLTGTISEAGTIFESGKTLELESEGLTASSHTPSLFDGVFANYYINVFNSDDVLLEDEGVFTFIDCNPDTDPL